MPLKNQDVFGGNQYESMLELPEVTHDHSTLQFVCSPEFPRKPQQRKSLEQFSSELINEYYQSLHQLSEGTNPALQNRQQFLKSNGKQRSSATTELNRALDKEQMILVKQWYFRNQSSQGLPHFFDHQLVQAYFGRGSAEKPRVQESAEASRARRAGKYR